MSPTQTEDRNAAAREQAKAQLASIIAMVAALECEDEDDARRRIEEDALSVEVRGDWHSPGDESGSQPTEFKILLCTGGPACQIIGELDNYNQPYRARIEFQDWFTSWEELIMDSDETAAVLTYCQVFYFGG